MINQAFKQEPLDTNMEEYYSITYWLWRKGPANMHKIRYKTLFLNNNPPGAKSAKQVLNKCSDYMFWQKDRKQWSVSDKKGNSIIWNIFHDNMNTNQSIKAGLFSNSV